MWPPGLSAGYHGLLIRSAMTNNNRQQHQLKIDRGYPGEGHSCTVCNWATGTGQPKTTINWYGAQNYICNGRGSLAPSQGFKASKVSRARALFLDQGCVLHNDIWVALRSLSVAFDITIIIRHRVAILTCSRCPISPFQNDFLWCR